MRKRTVALSAVAVLAGVSLAAGLVFLKVTPLRPPKDICRPAAGWPAGGPAAANLKHPMGLSWGAGALHVADAENGAVKRFGPDGLLLSSWSGFQRPVAVAATREAVFVADFLADQIVKLRPNGEVLARWGAHGAGPGAFDAPSGVAVDARGHVYVTDFYNHRVQKFGPDGAFLLQWGGDGRGDGRFHYPTDVAVSPSGRVFVADAYNHRIQAFTPEGEYVTKWGGLGFGLSGGFPRWFRLAKALAADPQGDLYVADAFNRRVQKFSPTGRLLGIWDGFRTGELRYPAGVAAGPDGAVYVSDFFEGRLLRLHCS